MRDYTELRACQARGDRDCTIYAQKGKDLCPSCERKGMVRVTRPVYDREGKRQIAVAVAAKDVPRMWGEG